MTSKPSFFSAARHRSHRCGGWRAHPQIDTQSCQRSALPASQRAPALQPGQTRLPRRVAGKSVAPIMSASELQHELADYETIIRRRPLVQGGNDAHHHLRGGSRATASCTMFWSVPRHNSGHEKRRRGQEQLSKAEPLIMLCVSLPSWSPPQLLRSRPRRWRQALSRRSAFQIRGTRPGKPPESRGNFLPAPKMGAESADDYGLPMSFETPSSEHEPRRDHHEHHPDRPPGPIDINQTIAIANLQLSSPSSTGATCSANPSSPALPVSQSP